MTADREAVAVDRQYRWRVEADVEARAEPATAVVAEFLNPSGAWCPVRNIETCARLLAITPTIAAPSAALDFDLFAGPLRAQLELERSDRSLRHAASRAAGSRLARPRGQLPDVPAANECAWKLVELRDTLARIQRGDRS